MSMSSDITRNTRLRDESGFSRPAGHLDKYYDRVVSFIRDADAILILGPGEAKGELKSRLEGQALGGHIVGVETVDKMTDHQIAATVRKHFLS